MKIDHFTPDLAEARLQLLQSSLRDTHYNYSIVQEYPIVLNPDNREFSFCMTDSSHNLVAHLNLWPRELVNIQSKTPCFVGLVGNVATAPTCRGRGLMKEFFETLWKRMIATNIEALILWSDLLLFYHKLGFDPCGREHRFFYKSQNRPVTKGIQIRSVKGQRFTMELNQQLQILRNDRGPYLKREYHEFKALLNIPDTVLLVANYTESDEPVAYVIVGKGADMIGVVHEWGARKTSYLFEIFDHILDLTSWPQLCLLAPYNIDSMTKKELEKRSCSHEQHSMALIKERKNGRVRKLLETGFLWGLDSI